MKKLICIIAALVLGISALAQTPEEIITRMDETMTAREGEGLSMTVETKLFMIGKVSMKMYSLGNKMRIETNVLGHHMIDWSDDTTDWSYNIDTEQITITNAKEGSGDGDEKEMLSGITDGYDVSLKSETDKEWVILCKKSKGNKEKDAPKTMTLTVSKSNYYPVSLVAKVAGVNMVLKDFGFGVSEDFVTFNPANYPNATIEDKR